MKREEIVVKKLVLIYSPDVHYPAGEIHCHGRVSWWWSWGSDCASRVVSCTGMGSWWDGKD